MDALKQLEKIKENLDRAKEEKANINGQISAKIDQLVALGFKKDSKNLMGDIEKKLEDLETEITDLEFSFEEGVSDFQREFPVLFKEG